METADPWTFILNWGRAWPSGISPPPDVTRLCYVSHRDDTLVLFTLENSRCTGFRLMSPKNRFYKWHFCEKSPRVSENLATQSGIKLGISKSRVKAILGEPQSESDQQLEYAYELKRKRTDAENEMPPLQTEGDEMTSPRREKIAIRAEFSEDRLILFDVMAYSQ